MPDTLTFNRQYLTIGVKRAGSKQAEFLHIPSTTNPAYSSFGPGSIGPHSNNITKKTGLFGHVQL
jgi:hypothetical protein